MDGGNEQRVAIKFCFKAGLSATETTVLVQKGYGNEALNRSDVFRWHSRFWDGRKQVEVNERCGLPKSTRIAVNIAAVADLVKNNHRIASKMIAESLNIPRTVVLRILKEDLGKKVVCTFSFHTPWQLSKGKIESHLAKTSSRWPMQTVFLNKIITVRWDLVFCLWPRNKATKFWMGLRDISSAKETEIPKVTHQDYIDKFFRFSRRSAQRIRTRGKNSKSRIL